MYTPKTNTLARANVSGQGRTSLSHEKRFRNERLRESRLKRGMQQDELARHMKTNTSTLSRIENGKKQPDPEMLILMAELFGTSTDYLLGMTGNPGTTPSDHSNVLGTKHGLIDAILPHEVIEGLSQERLTNVITYINDQYTLSRLDDKETSPSRDCD